MKGAVFLLTLWILAFSNGEMESNSSTLQRSKRAGPKAFFYYYEKLAAVRKHNEKRRLPGASNMQIMYWDYVLENVAQGYANKCIYKHNPDRTTSQKKYSTVGENLFYTTGVRLTADDFVNLWYEEVSDYNYSDNTCTAGKVCGHYTQVVWHNSYAVGCGVKFCPAAKGYSRSYTNILLVVCNYGPAGNWNGQKPYQTGTNCSSCPASKPTCEDGLCSAANCGGRTCQNGGILVTDVCMCDCRKTGFEGDLCEISTASITTAASAIVLASVLCSVSAYFTLV